jgi:hypothetical protein
MADQDKLDNVQLTYSHVSDVLYILTVLRYFMLIYAK